MLNSFLQLTLMLSVLGNGNGQNTQKMAENSCEKELEILTKDLQELIDNWIQIKSKIYG